MIRAKRKGIFIILAFYATIAYTSTPESAPPSDIQDSTLLQYEGTEQPPAPYGENSVAQYDAHEKEIIPAWATGSEEVHDSTHNVCFNGVCEERRRMEQDDNTPAGNPHPPILREDEDEHQPQSPPYPVPTPFDPERPSRNAVPVGYNPYLNPKLGKMPISKSVLGLMGGTDGPATGYGNGPTKDDALGVLFSIGDDDTYLLLSYLSMDLPMKNLVSNITVTTDEVSAQDRRDYLMSELEGKGSIYGLDNGLNILYSAQMFFYIPKTAISLIIHVGRIIYSKETVDFLRRLKLNTGVFTEIIDRDGKKVFYIPVYGGTIALANPSIPIVSQYLITSEGYGISLLKAKRVDIEKGILVLSISAYDEGDITRVAGTIQKFTSGEVSNPFSATFEQYGFEEESQDEGDSSYTSYSSVSSSSSSVKRKGKGKGSSSSQEGDGSSDSSSDSDTGSHPHSKHKGHHDEDGSSSSDSSSESKEAVRDTIDSLLEKARKWREKAALASEDKKGFKKHALKQAKKAERKAKAIQKDAYNEKLLKARRERSAEAAGFAAASETESASRQAAGGAVIEGEHSASTGSSWYSGSMKKNTAIKAIITSKESASASASASAFEESSRKTASSSFTSSGASAIISAHQSNEMYYKGVSSSEYATREIKHSLMGMTMQHALFSTQGRMYQSQKYSTYGVRSSRSSSRWLRRRITRIRRTRRAESRAARQFMKNGATSKGVAAAAAKEQAARAAAIRASRRAAQASQAAASYAAMAKRAEAQSNKKMAKSYKKTASKHKQAYTRHRASATKYAAAVGQFKAAKLAECAKQSAIFMQQISNPQKAVTEQEMLDLNKAVAQILTSSQIQLLSHALSAAQVRVLTSLLTPQQVQQTLVHIGAMTPLQMQGLLIRLQLKGIEIQKGAMAPLPNIGIQSAFPLGSPMVANISTRITGAPAQMTSADLIKFLTSGQSLFQAQESLVSQEQIESMKMEAVKQSQMIKQLITQVQLSKNEIETRVREKMFSDRMKSSISVCNPMMGMRTGMATGAFDGISSSPGLQLAGNVCLGNNSFSAMRQLLVSPSVSSYIGIDQNMLSDLLYNRTQNNDLMCLLAKSSMASPMYSQMPNDEQSLINARFQSTQNKLYGIYGNSLGRLEQALASAFSLIRNSSVKCKQTLQQTPPACQIQPQLSG
ncbi:hypothetical protein NEPAR04_0875 [Nematocida parisii]|nr:hypothetical protein NEPAR08_0885 [Nematocida parisii]KAI5129039.1 hypothetical protein NEPAR03_1485 [Nematocida parisii]KAI5141313.1 hypothetical protein NEPAR04_0875 [Nematocida parisii]